MPQQILIRLYQPDAKGLCDFEDSTGEWAGAVFVPLSALRQMIGEPFAYFEAQIDSDETRQITIGDRVADQGWSVRQTH